MFEPGSCQFSYLAAGSISAWVPHHYTRAPPHHHNITTSQHHTTAWRHPPQTTKCAFANWRPTAFVSTVYVCRFQMFKCHMLGWLLLRLLFTRILVFYSLLLSLAAARSTLGMAPMMAIFLSLSQRLSTNFFRPTSFDQHLARDFHPRPRGFEAVQEKTRHAFMRSFNNKFGTRSNNK